MTELELQIGWYPGHMAKAARRIAELLRAIDVVVEIVDARIARSGRNPLLAKLAARRTRVLALNRADLADPAVTKRWLRFFAGRDCHAVAIDGRAPRSVARLALAVSELSANSARSGIARAIVVGVPNSGKSTVVNSLLRRAAAKSEGRAGVTRRTQWFRLSRHVELLDTPGLLPPKIAGLQAQWRLALCGAVPFDLYDAQEVVREFHQWLVAQAPGTTVPDLERFASRRGFIRRGGAVDYHNAARSYISAFNDGAFGRISLEAPDDSEAA